MSNSFGLMIEATVAVLLLVTIGYCIILNSRLKRLRADEQSLKGTIAELITATSMAERAVVGLRGTAHEVEGTLGPQLNTAERLTARLDEQITAADRLLARLTNVVMAGRPLEAIPAASKTPDPQAIAAAARSFADRVRSRPGTRAA